MVNPNNFTLSNEQIITKLTKENQWYNKTYGPYIERRGLRNWRNLFRRPNILEWTILVMLLIGIFMGWAYERDVTLCRDYIKYHENQSISNLILPNYSINLENLKFNEEIIIESGGG